MSATLAHVGLNINKNKTKVIRANTIASEPIIFDGEALEEVENFIYLKYIRSVVDKQGGTGADVKATVDKARAAFLHLKSIWRSKELTTATKVRIFNSNIKSVLLYGSETWRTTLVH